MTMTTDEHRAISARLDGLEELTEQIEEAFDALEVANAGTREALRITKEKVEAAQKAHA